MLRELCSPVAMGSCTVASGSCKRIKFPDSTPPARRCFSAGLVHHRNAHAGLDLARKACEPAGGARSTQRSVQPSHMSYDRLPLCYPEKAPNAWHRLPLCNKQFVMFTLLRTPAPTPAQQRWTLIPKFDRFCVHSERFNQVLDSLIVPGCGLSIVPPRIHHLRKYTRRSRRRRVQRQCNHVFTECPLPRASRG